MNTSEKVAYLKGLAEGLGLANESKEEKLITAIIDVLENVARDIEELEDTAFDLGEEIDAISDDLELVEDIIYDECCGDECCCGGHDEDECCGGHDEDECCGGHGHHEHEGECCGGHGQGHHGHNGHHEGGCCGGHGHHGVVMYEVTCPACENTITIDEDVLRLGAIECPSCGGLLEFDFENSEGESAQEE